MATLYQMLGQAVRSEDPKVMLAKIQDFERTFEQRYGRKMTYYELSMLKTAREIVNRELWAEKLREKGSLEVCRQAPDGFAQPKEPL